MDIVILNNAQKKEKIVMVFGTFDIFHEGHKNFLIQAKAHGGYLIVVIARDETVKTIKNGGPKNNEYIRLITVKESKIADEVILGDLIDKYAAIKNNKPHVVCLGYDQNHFTNDLSRLFPSLQIIRLKPYKQDIYKSSLLSK